MADDYSAIADPVQASSGDDYSSIADPVNLVQPKASVGDVLSGAGKSLAEGAASGGGSILKGLAMIDPENSINSSISKPNWTLREYLGLDRHVPVNRELGALDKFNKIKTDSAYQLGNLVQESAKQSYAKTPEEASSPTINKVAGMAGGFASLVASMGAAPLTIGLQTAGDSMQEIYDAQIAKGKTPDQASEFAVSRALKSGATQAAIFELIPKPLQRLGQKFIIDKIGVGVLAQFLARRLSGAAEGATIGATSTAAGNIATDKPVGENVAAGGAALGAIQAVLPRAGPEPAKAPSIVTQMDSDTHGTPGEANVAANEIAMKPIQPVATPAVEPAAPANSGDLAMEAINKNIRDNAPPAPETAANATETPAAATVPSASLKDVLGFDPRQHVEPAAPTVSRYDKSNYDAYVEHSKEFNKVVDKLKQDPENVELNQKFIELFKKNEELKNLNGGWAPEPPANAPVKGLLEGENFDKEWQDQGGLGGSENQLVFKDGKVYKRNYNQKLGQAMPNYEGDLQAFKDHIDLHNDLFPSAKITLEGFSDTSDGPAPVTSQPEIQGKPANAREIRKYMMERDFVPSGGGRFTNEGTGIEVSDLTGRNVLKDKNGDLHVIDPQIKRVGANDPYAAISEPVKSPTQQPNAVQVQSPESVSVPPQAEAGQAVGGEVRSGIAEAAAPRQETQVTQNDVAPPEAKLTSQLNYRNKTIADISSSLNRTLDSPSVDIGQKQAIRDLIDQVIPGYPDTIKASTKGMSITQLEDLRDRISSIQTIGRDVVRERRAIVEQNIRDASDVLKASKSSITESTPKTNQIGIRLNPVDKTAAAIHDSLVAVKNGWSALDQHTANRDTVFNMGDGFSGFRGGLNMIFGGGLDEAYTHEQNLKSDWKEPIQKAIDSGWIKNKLGFGELDKKSIERVNIYAQNRMDLANPTIPNTHLADSGITPMLIDHINKTITPRELDYYKSVRDVLDNKSGPSVRDAMHQGFNIEVGQIKDYWPTQVIERKSLLRNALGDRVKGEAGAEASIRELINDLHQDISGRPSSKTNRGQTIDKQSGASGVINLSENLIDRHLNQAAHLVSHAEVVSNLAKIARADWFAEKYGSGMQKYTLNLLDSVARDSDPAGSLRIPVIDTLAKNYAVAILALRVFSQLKHVGNLAYALNEVGPTALARGFIDANTKDGRYFLKRCAPEAFQRSGGETTIQELIAGNKFQRSQAAMFAAERIADRQIAAATTLASYRNELSKRGIPTENYLMQGLNRPSRNAALITARKVVTSSLRKDSPQAISRGSLSGGSMTLSRLQWQFQQTALRQIHYAKTELLDEGIKQGEIVHAAKAAAAILGALAFETAMVHLSKSFVGTKTKPGDNNSLPQEMAGEEIRKIPLVGNIMTAGKYGGTGLPTLDVTTQGLHAMGNVMSGKNDFGGRLSPLQLKKSKLDALTFAASVAGVPGATTAGQYIKNKL